MPFRGSGACQMFTKTHGTVRPHVPRTRVSNSTSGVLEGVRRRVTCTQWLTRRHLAFFLSSSCVTFTDGVLKHVAACPFECVQRIVLSKNTVTVKLIVIHRYYLLEIVARRGSNVGRLLLADRRLVSRMTSLFYPTFTSVYPNLLVQYSNSLVPLSQRSMSI